MPKFIVLLIHNCFVVIHFKIKSVSNSYRLSNLQEMQEVGLYLTDLCLHDSSREIVLAGWQHGARLEISYEKVRIYICTVRLNVISDYSGLVDEIRHSS